MPNSITQVQPPLEFIPPAYNPVVTGVARWLVPPWRRWRAQVVEVHVNNADVLVDLYQQFQAGKLRFMLAFRHPSTNDPFCMAALLWQAVPKLALQKGIRLKATPHAHFIYDRGIPLWAGKLVGWLYSQLGGTPIRRGKVDLMGLRSIRQLFTDGQFPMAAAPEGATNGHNEIVSPIEPGIAQFGFWCIEDLHKANRTEPVAIVPVGIQYRLVGQPWRAIEALLLQLEADSGLTTNGASQSLHLVDNVDLTHEQEAVLYQRLLRLGEHLLTLIEQFYSKFYQQPLTKPVSDSTSATIESVEEVNQRLATRLQTLLDTVLKVAEQYFNLPAKGTVTDRCRRLEQAGWDRIYREDLKQPETLSPVERGLADRIAEEANLRLWHMRLVETFVSVTGRYVLEKPTVDRFGETLLLLWDMETRLKGKFPFPRPKLGRLHACITVGDPISVSDRWETYQANRRQAVATLTHDLQTSLEKMIL
ncbi:1-acyl-sn-glycerol-3-phosphate acyltransferase [Oculatella sp. LEGE 06141]|uniref:1-acyl-sn-glycerol-3-phosphate acyltransferase n=1 Tax=Oculatella sp. LEGE 06141 TaxID=1828648 RepID=UPI00188163FC|nr:1-acyl-sn-glycerol-3-phosphate acyltransferase [Oculatella sp. LEGE 06141]MBE9181111.1 1-acyl-sn-glycerol-3-phosphate acyltransferase [Oculatella sp. LEGE 06141]